MYLYSLYCHTVLVASILISPNEHFVFEAFHSCLQSFGPVYFMLGDNRLACALCTHPIFEEIHAHNIHERQMIIHYQKN